MPFDDPVSAVLNRKGHEVYSISPDDSVFDALRLMVNKDVGALLVLEGGRLTGVFSERDYARKLVLHGRSSRETVVAEVMNSPADVVTPDETVDACFHIMTDRRIRHLPVLHDGRVIGVVSIGDLVNWVITVQAETIGHLQSYIAASYPG